MRSVSEAWKNSIYESRKALLLRADMLLLTGDTLYLDYEDGDDDFMADGLTFEDATSNESSFDVGNAVMNTFSFKLNNSNDKYSDTIFTDAVITPYVGMELPDGGTEWVKKGKFIVSDPGKRGGIISFTAYDFMQKFETAFSAVSLSYPVTIGKMAQAICTFCGVTLATTSFPNSDYVINSAPAGSNYSCRQMISFIAQIAGCFARCNGDGELEIKWYEAVDEEAKNYHDITEYKSLETELKDTTITGVKVSSYYNENSVSDEDGNPVVENATAGSEGYMVSISNNPLIPYGKASEVANLLADAIVGTTFRPLNLTTFYDPSMEAGDTAVITDIKGNTYSFFVTNMTAKVGSDAKIICSAQTEAENQAEQYTGSAQVILSLLEATNAKFKDLATNHLEALVGEFGFVKTKELESEIGKFGYVTAEEAALKYATIERADIIEANINTVKGDLAEYKTVVSENFSAVNAEIENAKIVMATVEELDVVKENVEILFAEYEEVATLVNGNLTSSNIQSLNLTSLNTTIENGMIKNAMIESLTFDKITGIDINTTILNIHSDDGKSVWADNTIQISDANRVRVQIGKDASGDYTLAVWDAEGKLIWDALGATENTIQRAIIRDDVVADDANISGSKLDIESVVKEVNGATTKLSSTTVILDDKNQTLDVAFNLMETTVSENLTEAKTYADDKADTALSSAQQYALTQANSVLESAKSYADGAVDDVQIGGRNLIQNSSGNLGTTVAWYSNALTVYGNGGVNGLPYFNCSKDLTSASERYFINNTTFPRHDLINETYTVSGYVRINNDIATTLQIGIRCNSAGSIWVASTNRITFAGDGEWKYFSVTGTCDTEFTPDGNFPCFQIAISEGHAVDVDFCALKVEKGNKATDWSPAPEDTDAEISNITEITTTHTTQISTMQGQISSLIAEDTTIKGDYDALVSRYNSTVKTVDSIQTVISEHTTLIDANTDDILAVQTKANTLESDLNGTKSTVSAIQSDLTGVESRVSVAESTIEQHTTDISLAVKESDVTGNYVISKINLSSTTAAIAAKHIDLAGAVTISSFDSDALSTIKGYSTDAVNNLEVGGRNLFVNTNSPDALDNTRLPNILGHEGTAGKSVGGTYSAAEHGVRVTMGSSGAYVCYYMNGTNTAGYGQKAMEAGQEYTISFDWSAKAYSADTTTTTRYLRVSLYTDESGSFGQTIYKNFFAYTSAIKGTEQSGRCEWTFTFPEGGAACVVFRFWFATSGSGYNSAGDFLELRNLKLEKGNKASAWSPAPEDIDQSISEASIKNWCYNNDVTYIDGGKIYAKSVTAAQIDVDDLFAQSIVATNIRITGSSVFEGTLNGATGTFSGELNAATGTFAGQVNASRIMFDGYTNNLASEHEIVIAPGGRTSADGQILIAQFAANNSYYSDGDYTAMLGGVINVHDDINFVARHNGDNISSGTATVGFGVGTSGYNRGIYDFENEEWMIYRGSGSTTVLPGTANISTALQIGGSDCSTLQTSSGWGKCWGYTFAKFAGTLGNAISSVPSGYRPQSKVWTVVGVLNKGTGGWYVGFMGISTDGTIDINAPASLGATSLVDCKTSSFAIYGNVMFCNR